MIKYLIFIALIAGTLIACLPTSKESENKAIDSTRITTASFRVFGMDSITINRIQDTLQNVYGVTYNFACYSDTVVFVEYDSGIVTVSNLEDAIRRSGFQPHYEGKN